MEQESKLLIAKSIVNNMPSMVKSELSKMSAQKQEEFMEEYKRRSKSIGTAYLLFLIGFQYAYFNKWGFQFVYFLTIYGFFIWFLIDIFRLPSVVRNYNKDISIEILRTMKAISS